MCLDYYLVSLTLLVSVIQFGQKVNQSWLNSWTKLQVTVSNLSDQHLSLLSIYLQLLPKDKIMIGVIDMIVIITIDAVINKHIVDIDKHDIKRLLFECSLDIFCKFSNIFFLCLSLLNLKFLGNLNKKP